MLYRYDSSIQETCKEAIKIADLIPNICATFLLPPTFAYSHEILIQNEKWRRTSVTFPKWTRGAWDDEV